jgi:PAS domain S-box-containing protein
MLGESQEAQAAPAAVSEGEYKYRNLVETVLNTIIDGVVIINKRGEIQSFNRACEGLFGYHPSEVIGKNVKILMPDPYRAQHDDYLGNYQRTHIPKIIGIGREVTGQRKDGSVFPMELAVGDTHYDGEYAYIGIIRDLRERKEAEKANEQLRQSQKMESLGQLTGGVAHDFNNLLAVIIGNLDYLDELVGPRHPFQLHIQPALKAALQGAELTKQLLAFGRKQALRPKTLDLNELIERFTHMVGRTLGDWVVIRLSLLPDVWRVRVDPNQLENALLNLAVNARDALPKEDGRIVIETRNVTHDEESIANSDMKAGEYVELAISDNGSGMPPEVLAKVFEPFFTTKEVGKGSGLGLSMVYGFVKQSGGHIRLYSDPGIGTTVRLYLPRSEKELHTAAAKSVVPYEKYGQRVLVVEDNPEVLSVSATMVESLGYEVLKATSGDEALLILKQRNDIDLLMTDVMMPGLLNGPALAKEARKLHPQLKVLFNSGYAEHAMRESGMLEEGVFLLVKPFRKGQLAEKLNAVLR